jgi:hypothetical protein
MEPYKSIEINEDLPESGYVRELSRDEWVAKMQEYDIVGFRVVLRES